MAEARERAQFLNIRPGELPRVAALFGHLAIAIGVLIILKSVASALFLKRVDPTSLPYLYIAAAVVASLAISLSTRFIDRMARRALIIGTTLAFAASLALFWSVLRATHADLVYPALYLWVEVYATVMATQFWTFAGDLFTGRQGRRLFGIVTAGGVVGSIAGGALVSLLAQPLGSEHLLLLSGGLLLGIPPLVVVCTRDGAAPARPHKRGRHQRYVRAAVEYFGSHRYPWLLAGMVFSTMVATTIIDYQFKLMAAEAALTESGLARFLGQYNFIGGVLSLVLQLFVTSFVLNRLGVSFAFLIMPLTLLVGTSVLLTTPALWVIFVVKLLDSALSHSVDLSGKQLLYVPLPERLSGTLLSFIEGVVGRFGLGFAGLILLPLGFLLTTVELAYVTLGFLVVWLALALRVRLEYREALRVALQEEGFRPAFDPHARLDRTTVGELLQALETADEGRILVALDFLDQSDVDVTPRLESLLRAGSPEIHRRALRMVTETGGRAAVDVILEMLRALPAEVTAEAVEAIGRLAPEESAPLIQGFLDHADPRVRGAAIRAVLADGRWDAHDEVALARFEEMLAGRCGDEELCRMEAARALADEHLERYRYYLLHFLRDGSPEVQRAAIAAAGRLRRPEYVPMLLEKTLPRRTREPAIAALAAYGEELLPILDAQFEAAAGWKRLRKNQIRVLSQIGTPAAAHLLLTKIKFANSWERYDAIKALNKIRARRPETPLDVDLLQEAIVREAEDYYRNAHYLLQLGHPRREHLLLTALFERLRFAAERVSRLLALIYPPGVILSIYRGVYGRNARAASNAHELLDNLIDRPVLRGLILPMFDDLPVERTVGVAAGQFAFVSRTVPAVLEEIAGHSARWLKLCALYFAGDQEVDELRPLLDWTAREDPDREARLTAQLALRFLDGEEGSRSREGEMETLIEKVLFLKEVEIFSSLTGEDLTELAGYFEEVTFAAGETIFDGGERGDAMYVIVSGRVDVYNSGRLAESRGPQASLGELSAVDQGPRTFTAVAGTDVRALQLGELELNEILQENAEISQAILRVLAGRVRRYLQLELKALAGAAPVTEPAL